MSTPGETRFDTRGYWEQRLHAHFDITGVGYLGLGSGFVRLQYQQRMHEVDRALGAYGLRDLSGHSVLDAGAGTGFWMDFWHRHHASRVVGLDFTQVSVDRLRERFPGDLVVQADLSAIPLPLKQDDRFDVISVFDVLLHVVDLQDFHNAIANLAYHCVPGGLLIISDAMVAGGGYVAKQPPVTHNRVRTVVEFRDALEANDFTVEAIRPTTILLNNPLEAPGRLSYRALALWWRACGRWGNSDALTRVLGPVVLGLDQVACRFAGKHLAPTSKLLFARKRG